MIRGDNTKLMSFWRHRKIGDHLQRRALIISLAMCKLQKSLHLINNHFFDLFFADLLLMLLSGLWSLDSTVRIFCAQLIFVISLHVNPEIYQVLELRAAHIAGIRIGAVH
jgi:hypothetical protein